jgi:hypothetical protein
MLRNIRRLVSITLIITAIFSGIIFIFSLPLMDGLDNQRLEIPITNPQGLVVNKHGIFIGNGVMARIQQYDLNGKFKYAFKTDTYGKDYRFVVDTAGYPIITCKNCDSTHDEYPKLYAYNELGYFCLKSGFGKKVVCIKDGKETTIINQPFYINAFVGSMNHWITMALCLLSLHIINYKFMIEYYNLPDKSKQKNIFALFRKIFK